MHRIGEALHEARRRAATDSVGPRTPVAWFTLCPLVLATGAALLIANLIDT
jgi:hypothetical protein